MHSLGIIIAALGAVLLVALTVMHLRHYGRFVKYLELRHYEHWKSTGSPVQFEDEPKYGSFGYAAYFANRHYAELGDSKLSLLGDKIRSKRKLLFASLFILVIGLSILNEYIG